MLVLIILFNLAKSGFVENLFANYDKFEPPINASQEENITGLKVLSLFFEIMKFENQK